MHRVLININICQNVRGSRSNALIILIMYFWSLAMNSLLNLWKDSYKMGYKKYKKIWLHRKRNMIIEGHTETHPSWMKCILKMAAWCQKLSKTSVWYTYINVATLFCWTHCDWLHFNMIHSIWALLKCFMIVVLWWHWLVPFGRLFLFCNA